MPVAGSPSHSRKGAVIQVESLKGQKRRLMDDGGSYAVDANAEEAESMLTLARVSGTPRSVPSPSPTASPKVGSSVLSVGGVTTPQFGTYEGVRLCDRVRC